MARDMGPARKVAVVLTNLGGPDRLEAVRPFLFNLFSDPAIIPLPAVLRYPLARLISWLREKSAQANYARMGGASPLLAETRLQATALQTALADRWPGSTVRVFIAMRYWAPTSEETARAVEVFEPNEVVILPLYPQFSTTTTASSLKAWRSAYAGYGTCRAICCYPVLDGLVDAHAARIEQAWLQAGKPQPVRLLFSAHGLPQKVVDGGDPYQAQIEATATAVAARLPGDWDWEVCYQSRVGPMTWLGPSTPEAIAAAAAEGLGVVVTPIAFVSEHIETLVELDHDYAQLAERLGCPVYVRAPALGAHEAFISALADVVAHAAPGAEGVEPGSAYVCRGLAKCARTCASAGETTA